MPWEDVTAILGEPDGRRDGTPFYDRSAGRGAEEPVFFEVADGVVERSRFGYYVD